MSIELHIKPAPGCLVRDPRTRLPLAKEGEKKPQTGYWLRRLRDGSVVKVEPKSNKKREASDV